MGGIEKLYNILKKLRGPDGCPWDREQTNMSIRYNLIEEAHEVIEAIERGDWDKFDEEIGDLLLLVLMHILIQEETGRTSIEEIAQKTCDKLIERHPHVFGNKRVSGAHEVLLNWELMKNKDLDEDIPRSLPALLYAQKIQKRASRLGFDWTNSEGPLNKVKEELIELERVMEKSSKDKIEEELGDLLFAIVNLSRHLGIEPESALKKSTEKFTKRFKEMREMMQKEGKSPETLSLEELDEYWEKTKNRDENG